DLCLFAAAADPPAAPGQAVVRPAVIRVRNRTGEIGFSPVGPQKQRNAYYGVVPFATTADGVTRTFTFEECKAPRNNFPIDDPGAVLLARRPWAEDDPRTALASRDAPWTAFRLNLDADWLLFDPERPYHPVGAAFYNRLAKVIARAYPKAFV